MGSILNHRCEDYSRVVNSRSLESDISAVQLETVLADSHVFARRDASCIFYFGILYHRHNTITFPLLVVGEYQVQIAADCAL
jgi:hypothetical protein